MAFPVPPPPPVSHHQFSLPQRSVFDQLLEACTKGSLDDVKRLTQQFGPSFPRLVCTYNAILGTPLGIACEEGHLEVVRFLCLQANDVLLREMLIGSYGQISQPNSTLLAAYPYRGVTPLHRACYNGRFEVVQFLCSLPGIEEVFNIIEEENKCTPLAAASITGNVEIVKFLLSWKNFSKEYIANAFNKTLEEDSSQDTINILLQAMQIYS